MAFKYSPDKMRQGALSRDFIAPVSTAPKRG